MILQCYKSVCFDLVKAAKKMHKKQRLNVLYIISDICRKSKARLGSKDKYGEPLSIPWCIVRCRGHQKRAGQDYSSGHAGPRFLNILPSVIQKLEAVPLHHVVSPEVSGPPDNWPCVALACGILCLLITHRLIWHTYNAGPGREGAAYLGTRDTLFT